MEQVQLSATLRKKEETSKTGASEYSDSVSLSGGSAKEDKILGIKHLGQRAADLKEQVKSAWEEVEQHLVEQGKTKQEISMQKQQFMQSQSEKQMLSLLKESALMYYLDSDTKLKKVINTKRFSNIMKMSSKEMAKEATNQAHEQIRTFVLDELENELILRTFKQDENFENCYKLIEMGKRSGVDCEEFVNKVWPNKKENLGLNLIDVPEQLVGLAVDVRADADAKRQRDKFDYKEEDQKDILINRLRALYMQISLRPNAMNTLKTWFKIWKLKNGMMQLKIFTQDLDEKVQSEAKTLAKIKTMEILDEALHERASFFDQGPDKAFSENKIKSCLKNLERLGFKLEDQEFLSLKQKADQDIYELALEERDRVRDLKSKKAKQLDKLIAKLEKEQGNDYRS